MMHDELCREFPVHKLENSQEPLTYSLSPPYNVNNPTQGPTLVYRHNTHYLWTHTLGELCSRKKRKKIRALLFFFSMTVLKLKCFMSWKLPLKQNALVLGMIMLNNTFTVTGMKPALLVVETGGCGSESAHRMPQPSMWFVLHTLSSTVPKIRSKCTKFFHKSFNLVLKGPLLL